MIAPPAMLGILGGGQLGRFFAMAAKRMGYQVTVLDPDPDAPAAAFADEHICAAYDDEAALEKLAQCAAVTTEFENVNAAAMVKLAQKTRVTPAGELVAIAQNRIDEKAAIRKASLPVTPYQAIRSREDLNANTKQLLPGILKTATLGYDGKGQRTVKTQTGLLTSLSSLAKDGPYILEKELDLRAELSVIVCRLDNNVVVTFPPAENIHDNGILAFTIVPARLPEELTKRAEVMAKHLAEKLDYVGVLAVEMFVVGDKQQLVVNEIAPRPHNSGHYTMDACVSDQFQQQVRIMCGLPPSRTSLIHPCCMVNLLGDIWGENGEEPDWTPLHKNPDTFLHLYGKKEARPGRKMGHFTVFAETADAAYEKAQNLFTSVCLGG
ncbi:MAG: 5-(carboxyamino)imidazole ribonucleotide synthase [Neisseriaceae bacterium]|nr:5-(carboxyamino)imidazole ribonucleotide synthase [Neisseriaceae bacterium]